MARVRKVALLGNSVVASSLASTLRKRTDFVVSQLGTIGPESLARLREDHPDAVILTEPATAPSDLIFQLLREHPGLLIIGADVGSGRMLMLSGRQGSLRTEDDLFEAIQQR